MTQDKTAYNVNNRIYQYMFWFVTFYLLLMHVDDKTQGVWKNDNTNVFFMVCMKVKDVN
jgi:hypothetical protein